MKYWRRSTEAPLRNYLRRQPRSGDQIVAHGATVGSSVELSKPRMGRKKCFLRRGFSCAPAGAFTTVRLNPQLTLWATSARCSRSWGCRLGDLGDLAVDLIWKKKKPAEVGGVGTGRDAVRW